MTLRCLDEGLIRLLEHYRALYPRLICQNRNESVVGNVSNFDPRIRFVAQDCHWILGLD